VIVWFEGITASLTVLAAPRATRYSTPRPAVPPRRGRPGPAKPPPGWRGRGRRIWKS